MKDQELPSESTSRPIFRQNLNITTSSANMHTRNSSSSKDLNKIVKLTSTTTKRNNPKTKKNNLVHERKEHIFNQHRNLKYQQQSLTIIVISTHDDMIGDHGSTPVQKSRSNNSSTCQININVEENLIHLDDPLASDETDNNEPNRPSNVVPKTTTKTKQDSFPKSNQLSDTNLRSHLGRAHKFTDFLYSSQRPMKKLLHEETLSVSGQNKKALDTAAIQVILEDSHAFNIFRKSGMQKFLSLATPGYRDPDRKTVVKLDIWKSIRQDHFLCLSAHYYDDHYEANSHVISFRRFLGTHYSDRIEQFISHEIEKLNIEAKIRSITTDNGADIRLAAQNK
ncbi:unnamed protein product [Rotaria socialis]|uniref:Uncharacterized protein n=1 Tax=Rotaria socialis TaxID=392032 RepID=A0A820WXT0_9BILA|nr:unnamed protein product [Rotaria socialis]CAF4522861.1 unnamed protein product [Rotaria socialis]